MQSSMWQVTEQIGSDISDFRKIFFRRGNVDDLCWEIASDEYGISNDIFMWLMKSSWISTLLFMLLMYIFIAFVFSLIYYSQASSIINLGDSSTLSYCFFFSFQTLATIGYGYMAPGSNEVNTIVLFEIYISMLVMPIISGVLYFKFSIPRSKVIFSDVCCLCNEDDKHILYIRFAHASHRYMINVEISLGTFIFNKHDSSDKVVGVIPLKLENSFVPLFRLMFLAQHVIDETSPLFNVLEFHDNGKVKGIKSNYIIRFFLVVQGTDSKTNLQSHDYKMYNEESFIFEEKFIDMVVPVYKSGKYPEAPLLQLQNISITTNLDINHSNSEVID